MTREEVLTALALEIHSNGTGRCTGCPLGDDPACTVTLAREALKLLKAQEPVEPKQVNRYIGYDGDGVPVTPETYVCGNCGEELPWRVKYCPECGRKVKWE